MADKEMKTLEFQGSSDRYLIRDDRFNPASKTSEMTQSVGLDASGKLWTKPGGSGGSSTSGGTVEDIYYAAAEGIPNDGTDCTSALQALVDRLYNAGGGTIVLSNGIYACKTINMRSKVSLIGQGIGATILKLLSGGSLKGHLYFPMYATGCAVSNMTLLGTDFSGWDAKATAYNTNDAGIHARYAPAGYYSISGTSGIYFEHTTEGGTAEYNETYPGYLFCTNKDVIPEGARVNYKFAELSSLLIVGYPGHGIYQEKYNYTFYDHEVTICACGCGIASFASDCQIYNIQVENCAYEGVYTNGGNNKFFDWKIIWNGQCTAKDDRESPFAQAFFYDQATTECYAMQLHESRTSMANIEAQDNYCSGIYLYGNDTMVYGLLSDWNGKSVGDYIHGWSVGDNAPQDCIGIYLKGRRMDIHCKTTQYDAKTVAKPPLKTALKLDYCRWSNIIWSDDVSGQDGNAAVGTGTSITAATPLDKGVVTGTYLNYTAL